MRKRRSKPANRPLPKRRPRKTTVIRIDPLGPPAGSAPLTLPTPHRTRTLLAWLIIFICVAFFAGGARLFIRGGEAAATRDDNAALLLTSRYVVGAHSLTSSAAGVWSQQGTDAMLKTLEQTAKSPLDRLH